MAPPRNAPQRPISFTGSLLFPDSAALNSGSPFTSTRGRGCLKQTFRPSVHSSAAYADAEGRLRAATIPRERRIETAVLDAARRGDIKRRFTRTLPAGDSTKTIAATIAAGQLFSDERPRPAALEI